jgi:lipid-A-disaccharide synthase
MPVDLIAVQQVGWFLCIRRKSMALRVLVSAGEVSGDQHLARVVSALRRAQPDCEVRGMAGRECAAAGAVLDIDCYRTGAAMGFSELVRSARSLFSSYRVIRELVLSWKPHVVVLVDYPGFNLRLAKVAHQSGAKVLYFIPPKVWAWRAGRVKVMRRFVDHVAAIFPFEVPFFRKHGFSSVSYVGHPLCEVAPEVRPLEERPYRLLLMPGSRRFEVERLLPAMLKVFQRLRADRPALAARVLVSPNMSREWLLRIASSAVTQETLSAVEFESGNALAEAGLAQAAILKSGTCNLEGALAGVPFVSVYSGSRVSKVIVSALVPLTEYSPVNIIRPGTVQELMQVTIDVDALYAATSHVLDRGERRDVVCAGLAEVRRQLLATEGVDSSEAGHGACGKTVSERVAQLILECSGPR